MPGGAPPGKRHAPNGAGSIYQETVHAKRASGEPYEYTRWVGSITLPSGARKRVVAKTQREATNKLNQLKGEQSTGPATTTDRQTVGEYLTWWMDNSLRCKPTTRLTYETIVRLYLVPGLGRVQVAKLQPEHVEQFMAGLIRDGHSESRANHARAILRQALNVLVRRRRLTFNAAALVESYRAERAIPEPMDADECQRWITALSGHWEGALFLLAIATGLRQGELLGLRWQDLDFERARLTVRQNMQAIRVDGHLRPTPISPKTSRSRRAVPIPSFALARLREHRALQAELRLLAGPDWEDNDLVFPNRYGRGQHAAVLRHAFARALTAGGLPHRRFHDLRHVYASLLMALGVHPFVAGQLLGHSTTRMTERYSHVVEGSLRAAVDQIDAFLTDPRAVTPERAK